MKKALLLLSLISANIMVSQVIIDDTLTIEELIQDALIGNPNFPASNFVKSTGVDFEEDNPNGIATFNSGGTDLPFEQGIVLTTGDALSIPGMNDTTLSIGTFGWPGDIDLEVVTSIQNTFNASFIQFDFVADVPSISLDFMMASEEYGGFECAFADTFAFILTNNATGISENLAMVPGTDTAISVITVHQGGGGACDAVNEAYFGRYNYAIEDPNISSINAEDSPIDFNGQTDVFVLLGDLIIGNSYTVKIVVADNTDPLFDSALFIRNSSFGAYPSIEEPPIDIVIEDTDNNGFEIFNLMENESLMLGAINTDIYQFDFSYYNSQADAEALVNPITTPEAYINMSALETIYVNMRNPFTGKAITTSFKVAIDGDLLSVDEQLLDKVVMYPNPVESELFIHSKATNITALEIYSLSGQLISNQYTTKNDINTINVLDLKSGVYLVKIISDNGTVVKRIIKQ